jgi:hydrogenase maturation protease
VIEQDVDVLIIGIGNELLRDDGAGIHVVRQLQALAERGDIILPAGTEIHDGGTLGRSLLPLLGRARAAILVDAMDGDEVPGTVTVLFADELDGPPTPGPASGPVSRLASAGDGVLELLALARLRDALPAAMALVGIQPAAISVGLDLSERVAAAVPAAIRAVVDTARRLAAQAAACDAAVDTARRLAAQAAACDAAILAPAPVAVEASA